MESLTIRKFPKLSKSELNRLIAVVKSTKTPSFYKNDAQRLDSSLAQITWFRLARVIQRYPTVKEIQDFLYCNEYRARKVHKDLSVYTVHTCYGGHDCSEVFREAWD